VKNLLHINCPSCGEVIEGEARIDSVEILPHIRNGLIRVNFKGCDILHKCPDQGERS
jgi:hypothetical protein